MVTVAAVTFFTGLTGAAAVATAVVVDVVLNFGPPSPGPQMGRISRSILTPLRPVGTRPLGGIRPHDPGLTARRIAAAGAEAQGVSARVWEGFDDESKTLTGGVGCGTCLEAEFAANTLMLFDRALEPRTGDIVLVEEIIDGSPYRAAKVYERTDDGPGMIYCNDGAYRLFSRASVKGRLVLAVELPEGMSWQQIGAEMRRRSANADILPAHIA